MSRRKLFKVGLYRDGCHILQRGGWHISQPRFVSFAVPLGVPESNQNHERLDQLPSRGPPSKQLCDSASAAQSDLAQVDCDAEFYRIVLEWEVTGCHHGNDDGSDPKRGGVECDRL